MIAVAALLLISLKAPTVTPARMVAVLGAMFAVTGAVVVTVVVWVIAEK